MVISDLPVGESSNNAAALPATDESQEPPDEILLHCPEGPFRDVTPLCLDSRATAIP